jgi:polysaccharide export outer membrane protein
MKSLNKFLITFSLAVLVSGGVEALGQMPAQTPPQAVPAVDAAKTRQRLVTKPAEDSPEASKSMDNSADVIVMNDETPAKPATTKKPELNASAKAAGATKVTQPVKTGDTTTGAESNPQTAKDPADAAADNRHEQASEEAAIVPYYNNFFNTYRLGPEDIISVNVFGQDRYSRSAIIVPPSGRISLALIPGGIFVNGKTVEEVAEAITKRYDEYIIGPQVSVSLDKASSYRYSVVGDVAQPGIRLMNRRLTVTEALSEAGGVLPTGNRSKVVVLRRQANGNLEPITVNVSAIYKGKAPDITYLVPGDQILVPGNKLKSFQKIMTFFPILNFARIFTGGIF